MRQRQVKIVKKKPGEEEQETETMFLETSQDESTEIDEGTPSTDHYRDIIFTVQSPEFDEQKDIVLEGPSEEGSSSPLEVDAAEKLPSPAQQQLSKTKSSQWRMDLHALGVSYKLKRLKQQLVMLKRLRGKQESGEDKESKDVGENSVKSFLSLMSLLNKQVTKLSIRKVPNSPREG